MSIILQDDASAHPPDTPPTPRSSRGRLVLRRFRRNRLALIGVLVIVLLYAAAFTYTWYWPWSYQVSDPNAYLSPPIAAHVFGTDKDGFDMYAQVMRGLQKSLTIGLLVAVLSTSTAAVVGSVAGYFRGISDRALMWLVDLLFHGRTWLLFVLLLAAFSWMITARIVRGMTLSLKEQDFVRAARLMGVPPLRVITRHILPQMSSLLIADATINVGSAILTETSLSYFGFGVQPPDVSLGTLIAGGTTSAVTFPWLFFIPGGLLVLTVLSVNLIGDGLRDALDPNSARGQRKQLRAFRKTLRS